MSRRSHRMRFREQNRPGSEIVRTDGKKVPYSSLNIPKVRGSQVWVVLEPSDPRPGGRRERRAAGPARIER